MSCIEIKPGPIRIPPFRVLRALSASEELREFVLYDKVVPAAHKVRRARLKRGAVLCWSAAEVAKRTPGLVKGYIRQRLYPN